MHELSICLSLLREVQRVAQGRAVAEVIVAVGPLSGVDSRQLGRAFEVARAGTAAEHANLVCRTPPVHLACSACGREVELPDGALVCPACGDWQVKLCSGDELMLESVVLREEAWSCANTAAAQ